MLNIPPNRVHIASETQIGFWSQLNVNFHVDFHGDNVVANNTYAKISQRNDSNSTLLTVLYYCNTVRQLIQQRIHGHK